MLPFIPLLILLFFQGVTPQASNTQRAYAPEQLQVCLRAQERWLIDAIQEHLQSQVQKGPQERISLLVAMPSLCAEEGSSKLSQGFFSSSRNRDGPNV